MTVSLENIDTSVDYPLGAATVAPDGASATINIPAGTLPVGLYRATIIESGGAWSSLCPEPLRVTSLLPPTVTSVVPPVAWTGAPGDGSLADAGIRITGASFRITPNVRWTLTTDPSVSFDATAVNWVSSTELSVVCPTESQGMPVGLYFVDVINPEGLSGRWSSTFEVTTVPPPVITDISPIRNAAAVAVTLTVTGAYFQPGAVVSMENEGGTFTPLATTFVSSTTLSVSITGSTLSQGIHPVWVENPDGRWEVFYSFQATSSAAG